MNHEVVSFMSADTLNLARLDDKMYEISFSQMSIVSQSTRMKHPMFINQITNGN